MKHRTYREQIQGMIDAMVEQQSRKYWLEELLMFFKDIKCHLHGHFFLKRISPPPVERVCFRCGEKEPK